VKGGCFRAGGGSVEALLSGGFKQAKDVCIVAIIEVIFESSP
jgi:hypothetical protein